MPVAQQLDGWVGPHALTEHELRSWLLGTRLGITLLITEKLAMDLYIHTESNQVASVPSTPKSSRRRQDFH